MLRIQWILLFLQITPGVVKPGFTTWPIPSHVYNAHWVARPVRCYCKVGLRPGTALCRVEPGGGWSLMLPGSGQQYSLGESTPSPLSGPSCQAKRGLRGTRVARIFWPLPIGFIFWPISHLTDLLSVVQKNVKPLRVLVSDNGMGWGTLPQ